MTYQVTSIKGSGKEIIQSVIEAKDSQLLIPPRIENKEIQIPNPPSDGKYIGLFSSGSSGIPKCIWNKEEHLIRNAELSAESFGVESHQFLLIIASPWHAAGFTWSLMAEYMDCEYLFISTKKGDHDVWLKTVQDSRPDFLFTVPAVLRTLYDEQWFVEHVAYGGYSIQHSEYQMLSPHCSYIYQGYGQTEAGGLISLHKRRSTVIPEQDENQCHGYPILGATIRCSGTKEHPAPIFLSSPTAIDRSEYDTGDVGYKDAQGRIFISEKIEIKSKSLSKKSELKLPKFE